MKLLVTGSAGHLGEGLLRALRDHGARPGWTAVGLDRLPSPFTDLVGSITDRPLVRRALEGVDGVIHAATLHKPHVGSHDRAAFVDVNVAGTLALLEEAAAADVRAFVFTSSTTAFGRALHPGKGAPAAWITEDVVGPPKNVYGATKVAAEDLCELVHRDHGLPVVILRTSRFFPEGDDVDDGWDDHNLKVNELTYRRLDLEDAVEAHLLAVERASGLGFARFVVSATTPFRLEDRAELGVDAAAVLARRVPGYAEVYAARGWTFLPVLDRVYVNDAARAALGWEPRWTFAAALDHLRRGLPTRSALALAVGAKGYHPHPFGVYTR
jgi:UDP-glucose 4-epimerase